MIFLTSSAPSSEPATMQALVMHPRERTLHPCAVRVLREGLAVSRVRSDEETTHHRSAESDPVVITWRTLRGFCADASFVTPTGHRLQVVDIDSDQGVLTLLAPVVEVSLFFGAVGRWAGHWRLARSPLGIVFGAKRRLAIRQVA